MAEKISDEDEGRLWGVPLYRRMLIVDPSDRSIIANCQNGSKTLEKEGACFRGYLEENMAVGNTAIEWHGEIWTMLLEPYLHGDEISIRRLITHEMWHGIQQDIGLVMAPNENSHLSAYDGRFWLKMEWKALAYALTVDENELGDAIEDALIFRRKRFSLFNKAGEAEPAFETTEGLAQYTGLKLSGLRHDKMKVLLGEEIERVLREAVNIWTFPFFSVPAYGLLADELGIKWRTRIRAGDDITVYFQEYYDFPTELNMGVEAEKRITSYGGDELARREAEFERQLKKRDKYYWEKLTGKDIVKLPLKELQMSFEPADMFHLGEEGIVLKKARISDVWGLLQVNEGVLLDKNNKSLSLSKKGLDIQGHHITARDWSLDLSDGYEFDSDRGLITR